MGRKSDARERILNSAFFLIYKQGYARTSLQEIARHAGVKLGSLHYFFPSKEGLAVECMNEYMRQVEQLVTAALNATQDPLKRLQKFFLLYCRFTSRLFGDRHYGCFFGNAAVEMSPWLPVLQRTLAQGFQQLRMRFVLILEEGKARGQLRKDCDAEGISWQLLTYVQGANLLAKAYNDRQLLHRLGGFLADLLHPYLPPKRAVKV